MIDILMLMFRLEVESIVSLRSVAIKYAQLLSGAIAKN